CTTSSAHVTVSSGAGRSGLADCTSRYVEVTRSQSAAMADVSDSAVVVDDRSWVVLGDSASPAPLLSLDDPPPHAAATSSNVTTAAGSASRRLMIGSLPWSTEIQRRRCTRGPGEPSEMSLGGTWES